MVFLIEYYTIHSIEKKYKIWTSELVIALCIAYIHCFVILDIGPVQMSQVWSLVNINKVHKVWLAIRSTFLA